MNTPTRKRYVPVGHDPQAAADAFHADLVRAHGPLVAAVMMDGRPEVLDRAAAHMWALSRFDLVAPARRTALAAALSGAAAWTVFAAAPEPPDLVTSPLAVPALTRAGPGPGLGS